MNDQIEITKLALVVLIVIFAMAIFAHPKSSESTSDLSMRKNDVVKTKAVSEIPEEHPGGYELFLT